MSEARYLNAVMGRGKTFRIITEEYSRAAVKEFIGEAPAIALAPAGALDATVLLNFAHTAFDRSPPMRKPRHWECYLHRRSEKALQFCGALGNQRLLLNKCDELSREQGSIALFVSVDTTRQEFLFALRSLEPQLTLYAGTADSCSLSEFVSASGPARALDRESLREARQELLSQVASFTSEELASGGGSISDNPSQYALDLRSRGKVFGVRFGRTWHYPKFQFDAQRRAVPEMKAVLEALTPDPQGWDRLQWFVTPHERLEGKAPLKVWAIDRQKVIDAATAERWHGRRD